MLDFQLLQRVVPLPMDFGRCFIELPVYVWGGVCTRPTSSLLPVGIPVTAPRGTSISPLPSKSCLPCRLLLGSGVSFRIGPGCFYSCQVADCPGGLGLDRLVLATTPSRLILTVGRPNLASSVSTLTKRLVFLVKALFGFGSSLSVFWIFTLFSSLSSTWFISVTSALHLSPTLLDPL